MNSSRLSTQSPFSTAWHYQAVEGNRLELYTDGDRAFEAAYAAIHEAAERVWLETYIFEPDEVGNAARDALVDAARRGCDVILLFDRWGSPRIGMPYARSIVDAGGQVAVYNPVLPWHKLGSKMAPILHRDHRKILITDNIGFCGGRNVSMDYGGPGPELFFDLTLRIDGPCVHDLEGVFLESLSTAADRVPALPARPDPHADGSMAQVLVLNRRRKETDFDLALRRALDHATETCFLMTPYFVPAAWFKESILSASRRGIDVRILTAGRSDVPLARVAGRDLYGELFAAGIRVFEMEDPLLHAKCITIDGEYSIVGSYNVDSYGGKHNLEVGVASTDRELARLLAEEFHHRTADANEVDYEEWRHRPIAQRMLENILYRMFSI